MEDNAEMEDKKEVFLINTLDISAAGKNCKVLLGDINGDGRMELVCVQANGGTDSRYIPFYVTCVTAYALTGELLCNLGNQLCAIIINLYGIEKRRQFIVRKADIQYRTDNLHYLANVFFTHVLSLL